MSNIWDEFLVGSQTVSGKHLIDPASTAGKIIEKSAPGLLAGLQTLSQTAPRLFDLAPELILNQGKSVFIKTNLQNVDHKVGLELDPSGLSFKNFIEKNLGAGSPSLLQIGETMHTVGDASETRAASTLTILREHAEVQGFFARNVSAPLPLLPKKPLAFG